ncbi:MAG TPA: hypothetical protein VJZ71_15300 [Phycisphaerae bacterium]|nr:hypothetical protein [Phycisphaerae bacterium]
MRSRMRQGVRATVRREMLIALRGEVRRESLRRLSGGLRPARLPGEGPMRSGMLDSHRLRRVVWRGPCLLARRASAMRFGMR